MATVQLPDIEIPKVDLSKVDLPSIDEASRRVEATIDRLLRREQTPIWPWIVLSFVVIGLIGTIAAVFTMNRRATTDPIV